jgi:hypothetical protein
MERRATQLTQGVDAAAHEARRLIDEAAQWYERAWVAGVAQAAVALGRLYQKRADSWLGKAAADGLAGDRVLILPSAPHSVRPVAGSRDGTSRRTRHRVRATGAQTEGCPYCGDAIDPGVPLIRCGNGHSHHKDCWEEMDGWCAQPYCPLGLPLTTLASAAKVAAR